MINIIATIILAISNIEAFFLNIKFILFILLKFIFKINRYIFTDINKANTIKNYIKNNKNNIIFDYDDNDSPIGKVIGYDIYKINNMINVYYPIYLSFIYNFSYTDTEVWLICTQKYKNIILKENILIEDKKKDSNTIEDIKKKEDLTTVEILIKNTIYCETRYFKKTISPNIHNLTDEQKNINNYIINHYNKHNKGVFYIHGSSGLGKTYLTLTIAMQLNGMYCNTYKPTDPGDSFHSLHNFVEPTKDNPLIVILDEFDILIKKIHENKIEYHKYYSKEIYDKNSWNQFLDNFDYFNLYPYTILILCSNKDPNYINNLDKSYIRLGRIDKYFNIKEKNI